MCPSTSHCKLNCGRGCNEHPSVLGTAKAIYRKLELSTTPAAAETSAASTAETATTRTTEGSSGITTIHDHRS
jgi:hypothetical protein